MVPLFGFRAAACFKACTGVWGRAVASSVFWLPLVRFQPASAVLSGACNGLLLLYSTTMQMILGLSCFLLWWKGKKHRRKYKVLLFKIASRALVFVAVTFAHHFLSMSLCIVERRFRQATRFAPFASFALRCCI